MNETVINEIQIIPIKPHNGLLGFCSFVINSAFFVGDVAIYSRLDGNGYRLVYPLKILANGAKINAFHPINKEATTLIERRVTEAYVNLIEKVKTAKGAAHERHEFEQEEAS
jgi:DNA-binding cell septation regulator SpoVG